MSGAVEDAAAPVGQDGLSDEVPFSVALPVQK